jgi:hypothetical protein
MKPMIWAPDEHDKEVNQYLEQINHAPYEVIAAMIMILFCLFTAVVLIGNF